MVAGMLLTLVILFVGAFPDAIGSLSLLGKCIIWLGVLMAVFGVVFCLCNLEESNSE